MTSIFKNLDTNGDGRLEKEEIRQNLKKYYKSVILDSELDQLFEDADTDKSG